MSERTTTALEHSFAQLADGDRAQMENVFQELLPIVRAFCLRFSSQGEVDDAVQLSLKKIFSRAGEYDPKRPLLPWVCAISAWECQTLRTRIRRSRESVAAVPADAIANDQTPEGAAIERELAEAATRALGALSENDRAVLREAYWENARGGPAFRKRKQRALQRVRDAMRRIYGI